MAARPALLVPTSLCSARGICSTCHEALHPRRQFPLLNRAAQRFVVSRTSTMTQRAVNPSITAWGQNQSRLLSISETSRNLPPRGHRIPSRSQAAATELANQTATDGSDVEYEAVIGIETHVQLATATKVSLDRLSQNSNHFARFHLFLPVLAKYDSVLQLARALTLLLLHSPPPRLSAPARRNTAASPTPTSAPCAWAYPVPSPQLTALSSNSAPKSDSHSTAKSHSSQNSIGNSISTQTSPRDIRY